MMVAKHHVSRGYTIQRDLLFTLHHLSSLERNKVYYRNARSTCSTTLGLYFCETRAPIPRITLIHFHEKEVCSVSSLELFLSPWNTGLGRCSWSTMMSSHVDFHWKSIWSAKNGKHNREVSSTTSVPIFANTQYLQPSERAYPLGHPSIVQGYLSPDFGEFGQAFDFRCRVRFPTAWIPVRTVPHP